MGKPGLIGTACFIALATLALTPQARANPELVVLIECTLPDGRTSQGSGVLVSPKGHVLTARHAAPDGSTCTGRIGNKTVPPRGLIWPVEDRALPAGIDGRLLSFAPSPGEVFDHATYCTVASQPTDTALTARGFHRRSVSLPSSTVGVLSSITPDYDGFVETDTMVGPGKSGGPVFLGKSSTILGIVAGAQFDASGIVTNYAMLSIDALISAYPLLQEAPSCAPEAPAAAPDPQASFAPTIAYFDSILKAVKASPETARKLQRETINAHRAFFDDLTTQTFEYPDTNAALERAKSALLSDPIDPQAIRASLADAVTAQSNADLLSGATRTAEHATLLNLQAEFEAAILNRKEAARLYRQAAASFAQTETDAIWNSFFQAGHQLYLHARDTSDPGALTQSISLLEQARDLAKNTSDDAQWAQSHLKLGDAYARQSRRECGLGTLEAAKSAYADGLKKADKDAHPMVWSELTIQLGEATLTNAERLKSDALISQAIDHFKDALPVLEYSIDEAAPELRAEALNDLGKALNLRGMRAAGLSELEDAYKIFERALSIRSRAALPYDWSETRSNQGRVLAELGRRNNRGDELAQAVVAYEDSLEVRSRGAVPLRWAETQHSLAQALLFDGMRDRNAAKIKDAIAALNLALEVRDKEASPLEWAESKVSLGTAYFVLGGITYDDNDLLAAKKALEAALSDRFTDNLSLRECHPAKWASATNNLGNVLLRLGQSQSDLGYFEAALETYKSAGEEWRRDAEPLEWARLQHNMGTAMFGIGQVKSSLELIDEASIAFAAALELRDPNANSAEWVESALNLGATYLWKGRAAGDAASLGQASKLFGDVIASSGKNDAMKATASYLTGMAHISLLEVTQDVGHRQIAVEKLKSAEDYYLSAGDKAQAAHIRETIDQIAE